MSEPPHEPEPPLPGRPEPPTRPNPEPPTRPVPAPTPDPIDPLPPGDPPLPGPNDTRGGFPISARATAATWYNVAGRLGGRATDERGDI